MAIPEISTISISASIRKREASISQHLQREKSGKKPARGPALFSLLVFANRKVNAG
jgi:hypothetical protein